MTAEPTTDGANKEAVQYWGYLLKDDKCGTEQLNKLLTGIANFISKQFEPSDCPDIVPKQLAEFYRGVGGDYDALFVETLPSSIAFIYRALGCSHSLQPAPDDDGYGCPSIPALKGKGFVTWQTIQLLLGPEDHVPFLQRAVQDYDIRDPTTNEPFPKILPTDCFPDKPDDAMVHWYQGVAERLRRDAEEPVAPRVRVEVDEPRTSSEMTPEESADERHGAAKYFQDPLYRNRPGRPSIMRHFSKRSSPRQFVEDRSRLVANSVKHIFPFGRRRSSLPEKYEDDIYSDDEPTPTASIPPSHRPAYNKRPHPRRGNSYSSSDSDSERPPRHRSPTLRHRRSHEPASSPRDYFPAYEDEDRRYKAQSPDYPRPVSAGFGPSKGPLFATKVAQLQPNDYPAPRPSMPPRTSYRPHTVSYTMKERSPRQTEAPSIREPYDYPRHRRHSGDHREDSRDREWERRERDKGYGRSPDRSRDRERDRYGERERDRSRDTDRNRSRDTDRDRDRSRTHRYVAPVDGVSGRRYPVEAWR